MFSNWVARKNVIAVRIPEENGEKTEIFRLVHGTIAGPSMKTVGGVAVEKKLERNKLKKNRENL